VEVEGMTDLSRGFENIVVGVIEEITKHPNADKLTICKTDIGGRDIREIVCGGINLRRGMKVAVAKPGAFVRWHGEGEPVEIKNAKLRGIDSYGMICASSEIGLFELFPYEDEATIVDLSDFDAPAGAGLAEALGLDDIILEIDNKSLTNRPDLWGHYGVAREIAAMYDLPLADFQSAGMLLSDTGFKISLLDSERCPRYIGVEIDGLSVKPSPFDMQSRIWRVGMRPINAIVDITNYIMLATGQPTHAFDSDNIKGHIIVRRAVEGERLLLLNGRELELCGEDLVIADEEGPVALAGVMGGEKDSILPDTTKVILEIANFDALGVRRTSARHGVRTESAARYEKSIDPERGDDALTLAVAMFSSLYPGLSFTGFADEYPVKLEKSSFDVSLAWLEKCLGKAIANDEIAGMLSRLGFEVGFDHDCMHVLTPTWRSTGDVSIPNDIMEEVARMHGLENFEPTPIAALFDRAINQPDIDVDRKIREYLAFRCDMNEIFTYPWVSDESINPILGSSDGMLSLVAPPSPSERFLRSSLLPNLCKAVAGNLRFFDEFSIFESAQVFHDSGYEAPYDPRELLPTQRREVAGACVAGAGDVNSVFRRAKGIIEAMPRFIHSEPVEFRQNERPLWADEVLWLNIMHCGAQIGNLALLSGKAALSFGMKKSIVMLFEFCLDSIVPLTSRSNEYRRIPEYPTTDYDVSLLFDLPTSWEEILGAIAGKKSQGDLLRSVQFVDEYTGRQVPEGKKSITFRLVIGSSNKTLTSEEIEGCASSIIKRLGKTFNAEARGM
ncbi:MAG: phenylalanine--tRNA ligase subunit beta, partial [Oscillospiraceae bacterium]|nr:phenylalanine--tRNA ligase subunit beta [Oscillospiraceae bacterium]